MFRSHFSQIIQKKNSHFCSILFQNNNSPFFVSRRYNNNSNNNNENEITMNNKNRLAKWCRDIYNINENNNNNKIEKEINLIEETLHNENNNKNLSSQEKQKLYHQYKNIILSELNQIMDNNNSNHNKKEVPMDVLMTAALVKNIWKVFDTILPKTAQENILFPNRIHKNKKNQKERFDEILKNYENSFYEFLFAVQKNDIRLDAIETLNQKISEEIKNLKNNNNKNNNELLLHYCDTLQQYSVPLFYSWLKNTINSDEKGMERLLNFRKVLFFFTENCKKNVSVLSEKAKNDENCKNELLKWNERLQIIKKIDDSIFLLFQEIFSKEYLILKELNWENTSPAIFEKIIKKEHVHPFYENMNEMKNRCFPTLNRYIFAFFHPKLRKEPLIAVQVALTRNVCTSVDLILKNNISENNNSENNFITPLLDENNKGTTAQNFQKNYKNNENMEKKDTAIFYSINTIESALKGLNMGNTLIKRVVKEINENLNFQRNLKNLTEIKRFSTLSPIPGYTRWLTTEAEKLNIMAENKNNHNNKFLQHYIFGEGKSESELEEQYFSKLRNLILLFEKNHFNERPDEEQKKANLFFEIMETLNNNNNENKKELSIRKGNTLAVHLLLQIFKNPQNNNNNNNNNNNTYWWHDHHFTTLLEPILLKSISYYLCKLRKRGKLFDPVANFHISNGATIFHLNFLANTTMLGSKESGTVMVNYFYDVHHEIHKNENNNNNENISENNFDVVAYNAERYATRREVDIHENVLNILNS